MATRLKVLSGTADSTDERTLPAGWQRRSARSKLEHIWDRLVLPSEYSAYAPFEWRFPRLSKRYLDESFDTASDEMPPGHRRVIHQRGSVARIEWVEVTGNPYTGLFKGARSGLARLSLGAPPSSGFIPGVGIKLFVDGHPSANLQLLNSVDGQGDNHDFFALDLSSKIPPAKGILTRIGALFFSRTKSDPYTLTVGHLAERTEEGESVPAPLAPHQLVFVPGKSVTGRIDPESRRDFRHHLSEINAGTILYEVHAGAGADRVHVGNLVTRSRFVASAWGDEKLFFQHQR